MEKVKGTVSSVSDDIKPYVKRKLFEKYLDEKALSNVAVILLAKYSNVKLSIYTGKDGQSHLKVSVQKLLGGGELDYLIAQDAKSRKKYSLDWIDRIEELDALL